MTNQTVTRNMIPHSDKKSKLSVSCFNDTSYITESLSIPPLKWIHPKTHSNACFACLSGYGGGILGGDTIQIEITCHPDSQLFLTTQAHTKVYRSNKGESSQAIHGKLDERCFAVVLPDPIILQKNSHLKQTQEWNLTKKSTLLLVDSFISGRLSRGEKYLYQSYKNQVSIYQDSVPVLVDNFSSKPIDDPHQTGTGGMQGFQTAVNLYLVGDAGESRFSQIKKHLLHEIPETSISSSIAFQDQEQYIYYSFPSDSCVIMRILGKSSLDLHSIYKKISKIASHPELLGFDPYQRKF